MRRRHRTFVRAPQVNIDEVISSDAHRARAACRYAAVARIQEKLGVDSGDFASHFFDERNSAPIMLLLIQYASAEIAQRLRRDARSLLTQRCAGEVATSTQTLASCRRVLAQCGVLPRSARLHFSVGR